MTLQIALNAGGVLARAMEVATLQEALASCEGSIGFTRRAGSVRQVHSSLRRFHEAHPAYLLSPGKHLFSVSSFITQHLCIKSSFCLVSICRQYKSIQQCCLRGSGSWRESGGCGRCGRACPPGTRVWSRGVGTAGVPVEPQQLKHSYGSTSIWESGLGTLRTQGFACAVHGRCKVACAAGSRSRHARGSPQGLYLAPPRPIGAEGGALRQLAGLGRPLLVSLSRVAHSRVPGDRRMQRCRCARTAAPYPLGARNPA